MTREGRLTYGELEQRANRLAHFLRKQGAERGERVGVYLPRTSNLMVALLGVMKSGAAYVPLDPGYPEERIRLILEEAKVRSIVTDAALVGSLPPSKTDLVLLDRDADLIAEESSLPPITEVHAEDLAYVIFTSGSTGRPKGVEVPHRGVVNLLAWMGRELRMTSQDVFPALASFAFDMSVPELYLALTVGGVVALGDRHLAADGEELAKFLRQQQATVVHATPTTWSLLLQAGFTGSGLKRCIGAEPLPRELFQQLMEAAPGTGLYNFYGPTETTVWSSYHHFTSAAEAIVIGRPIANTQMYVLDAQGQPCPTGVAGEIYIGGDGVAKGYLGRPELTAERFLSNPFSSKSNARFYRTGDMGRFLPDGRIEFHARLDEQVKLRGYRIELGEIEAALNGQAGVRESVVVAREDVPGDKRLVAYVVPEGEEGIEAEALRKALKGRLPEYMVPSAFVVLEKLPLTPNGKVDRKTLPAPEYSEAGKVSKEASTPTEEIIAGIWEEVLRRERVGVEDDFFALGGHSLLATQVVSRIRGALGVELPLRVLFEEATVAGLARHVEQYRGEGQEKRVRGIVRLERGAQPLPLSFAQQRLWFLDQLEPGRTAYNVPLVMRLKGALDVEKLRWALDGIVARHETLRTVFRVGVDGEPEQVVLPESCAMLRFEDVSHLAEFERERAARQLVEEESGRGFDLAQGPVFRALLVKVAADDSILLLLMHHIVSDGWSLGIMSRDLKALYEDRELELLPVQYVDYAAWQREHLSGQVLAGQLAYWKEKMRGAPAAMELPTDRPRPSVQTEVGAKHVTVLSKELVDGLKRESRQQGVTLFMTLLASWQALLSRYTGQEDIVVGSPIAGRTMQELEPLIGFFVNTLVLRTDLGGDPTFRELLQRVRQTTLDAYAHQDVPFEKLVEELNPVRDMSRSPLFQVMLMLQNAAESSPQTDFGGLQISGYGSGKLTTKFDLTLNMAETANGLRCALEYNFDLFEKATAQRILDHFEYLLSEFARTPDLPLSKITLLTDSEREKLLRGGGGGEEGICAGRSA